jgi:hypothetical protein
MGCFANISLLHMRMSGDAAAILAYRLEFKPSATNLTDDSRVPFSN